LALRVLQEIDFPGWPLLIAWGSRPRDPLLVLTELGPHMRLLPEARRAEIARHSLAHESPTLRREAAAVLGSLDETVAAKVARAALRDEPDPIIRARLLALVKPPRRRAKRPPARGAARPGRRRP
jgi:hypothetical protein